MRLTLLSRCCWKNKSMIISLLYLFLSVMIQFSPQCKFWQRLIHLQSLSEPPFSLIGLCRKISVCTWLFHSAPSSFSLHLWNIDDNRWNFRHMPANIAISRSPVFQCWPHKHPTTILYPLLTQVVKLLLIAFRWDTWKSSFVNLHLS